MKASTFFFTFFSFAVLSSCNSNTSKETVATISGDKNSLEHHFKDSLVIDTIGKNFENRTVLINSDTGSYNLSVFKTQDGNLLLYNIDKKKSRSLGKFPKEKSEFFLSKNNILYAWVKRKKAIDIYTSINWAYKLTDSLYFPDKGSDKRYKFFDIYPMGIPLIFNNKNQVIVQILPDLHRDRDSALYFQIKNLGLFQIKGDSMVLRDEFAPFPQVYRDRFIGGNHQIEYCFKNDSIISYLYQNAPIIYEYNLNSKRTTLHHIEGLPQNDISKYDVSQSSSFQYDLQFHIENDWYIKLLFDKKNNRYIIFRVRKINQTKQNGKLSEWNDKPIEVFVIDSKYKTINKYTLPNQRKYFTYRTFVYNGFLYLIRNVDNSKEPLIIDKYEI